MADSFHIYLKKQLLAYVENERKKGVPLEEIEKVLLNAGQDKNIIDEVKAELIKEESGIKPEKIDNPVEKDIAGQLKNAFASFMAKANKKEIDNAKTDLEKTDTNKIVNEVIEEAEIIEEKTILESTVFFGYLVLMAVVILFATGGSQSELKNVIIGFLPAILSVFISFMALSIADNVPLYMFIPLGISGAFYSIVRFAHLEIFGNLDPEGLGIVNFLAGFIFNVMIVYVRFIKPRSMERRVKKKSKRYSAHPPMPTQTKEVHTEVWQSPPVHKEFKKRQEISELKKEFKL